MKEGIHMLHTTDKLENILRSNDVSVKYGEFNSDKPFISTKIDWFSGIFNQVTLDEVFKLFNVDTQIHYEEFCDCLNHRIINTLGALWSTVIRFKGIVISFQNNELFTLHCNPEDIDIIKLQHIVFNQLNVTISGSGLDELRSYGIDIDRYIYNLSALPSATFHITRCDFAFDFINMTDIDDSDIFDKLFQSCNECKTPMGRISTGGTQGLGYSVRLGDQRTIYLGSPKADRLLRVYDKKLEFESKSVGLIPFKVNGELPYSWIRIELQTRRGIADSLAFRHDYDMSNLHVLRYIYEKCLPRKKVANKDYITDDWINNLFDWEKLPSSITPQLNKILNIDNVDRASSFMARNLKQQILLYAHYGKDNLFDAVNRVFIDIQSSSEKRDIYRRLNINSYIRDTQKELPYLKKGDDGIYRLL